MPKLTEESFTNQLPGNIEQNHKFIQFFSLLVFEKLEDHEFLKSPVWNKINCMHFISNLCSRFIIIQNICRHTNRSNLIDNRQVTWQKSIISKFIWNNLFHACAHKICAKSCLQYCWWLMKNISSLKTMKCKYFINSQFWANC